MIRWKDAKDKAKEILKEIFKQPLGIASLVMLGIMIALAVAAPLIAGNEAYSNWQNISYWKDNPTGVPPSWISLFGVKYSTDKIVNITNLKESITHTYASGLPIGTSTTVIYYANYTDNYTAQVPYTDLIVYIYPATNWTILGNESFSDLVSLVQNKTLIKDVMGGYVNNITANATAYASTMITFLDRYLQVLKVCEEKIKSKIATTTNTAEKNSLEEALGNVRTLISKAEAIRNDVLKLKDMAQELPQEVQYFEQIAPPTTPENATLLAKKMYMFSSMMMYINKTAVSAYENLTKVLMSREAQSLGLEYYGAGFNTTLVKVFNTTKKVLVEDMKGIRGNIENLLSIPTVNSIVSDVENFMKIHGAIGSFSVVLTRPDGISVTILSNIPVSPLGVTRIDAKMYITEAIINTLSGWDSYYATQIKEKLTVSNPFNLLFIKWPHYMVSEAMNYIYANLTKAYQELNALPIYERDNATNVTLTYIPQAQKLLLEMNNLSGDANIAQLWLSFYNVMNSYIAGSYDQIAILPYPQAENASEYLRNALSLFSDINNELNLVMVTQEGLIQITNANLTKAELYSSTILPVGKILNVLYYSEPLHGTYKWSIQVSFRGMYPSWYLKQKIIEYVLHKTPCPPPTIAVTVQKVISKQLGASYGLLGTDVYGRDLWKGFVWGTRAALIVGLIVSVLTAIIGLIYGSVSGYVGGVTDEVMQRIVEIMVTLPFFPILIMIGYSMQGGISYWMVALLLVIFSWAGLARVIRSMALQIREYTFVEAARCLGASTGRILVKHVMPQMLPYLFANMAFSVPGAIITAASLAFLGVGDIIHPTWGAILHAAQANGAVINNEWWWVIPPGIGMMIIGLGFVFLGMALDRVLNPRLRRL